MKTEYNDGKLVISLEGRIDTNNASETEKSLFEAVEGHSEEEVVMDASGLEYISSAGLRALMKLRKSYGKAITITEVSPEVYEIFDTTGFVELFDVKKRLRQISVDGCEIIGEGGNGKVYKKDDETIVKVYYGERNDLEKIRRNQQVTKSVFVQGIPTAIAFDVVKVGENYGVVYEMINAKSLLQEMSENRNDLEKYANMIADTLINLHQIEIGEGTLQDARDNARRDIKAIVDKGYLTEDEEKRLYKLIDDIPARNSFVHQDFHPGNIMLQNGEIVLIDVEDSAQGHPVLELSSMYLVYVIAAKAGWGKKEHNLTKKDFALVWDIIIKKYFNTNDEKEIKEINRILDGYARIKYIRGLATSPKVPDFLRSMLIKKGKKKLFPIVDTLHPIP